MDAESYINELNQMRREGMIERASWIFDHRPEFSGGTVFPGGEEASILYEDAQFCYIDGIFSGAIILSQSFIERSICGLAYSAGEFEEGDRPSYHDAVSFLKKKKIIAPDDVAGVALDQLHNLRNPLAHFRPPLDESSLSRRMVERFHENSETEIKTSEEMLKEDAEQVLKSVFSVVVMFGVGSALE